MTQFRNIGDHLDEQQAIRAQAATADVSGAAYDRYALGGDAVMSGIMLVSRGTETGGPSTDTVQFQLQDSADGSTDWQQVTNRDYASQDPNAELDVESTVMAAPGDERVDFDLSGARRYVRIFADVVLTGGTSPTVPISAALVLGGSLKNPA